MRRPLAEVLAWPDSHVRLLLEFLSREPLAEDRVEMAMAHIAALIFNRSRGRNEPAKSPMEFLPFDDPWGTRKASTNPVDAEVAVALNRRKRKT